MCILLYAVDQLLNKVYTKEETKVAGPWEFGVMPEQVSLFRANFSFGEDFCFGELFPSHDLERCAGLPMKLSKLLRSI